MTLYELTGNYVFLKDMVSDLDETEDIQTITDTMEAVQAEIEDKADNYASLIASVKAEVEALKAERDRLNARIKTRENLADRLKENLLRGMIACEKPKFKTLKYNFSVGSSKSVEVDPDATIPGEYLRVKAEPNKTAISDALKEGKKLPFARFVEKPTLRIK